MFKWPLRIFIEIVSIGQSASVMHVTVFRFNRALSIIHFSAPFFILRFKKPLELKENKREQIILLYYTY